MSSDRIISLAKLAGTGSDAWTDGWATLSRCTAVERGGKRGGGSARDAVQCADIRRLPARLHEAVMTTTPGLAAAAAAARLSTEVSADWESIHMPTQIDGF